MNAQHPGPFTAHDNGHGTFHIQSVDGGTLFACVSYQTKAFEKMSANDLPLEQAKPIAALLAASYSAFDKAGRELGIDAAKLASSVDLAEIIRYALDYSQLHSRTSDKGNVGRIDQVKAARLILAPLVALMKKE